jgi:threonine/homoserine/homoserine lactone efflux protein
VSAAFLGFGLGFFVALQLGPMSLFLIRSTLRGGWRVGVAIGAGIATVDAAYTRLAGSPRN